MSTADGCTYSEARYANYFKVGHTAFEVLVEFGQYYNGESEPSPHIRIVTSPAYARSLLSLLQDSLQRYDVTYGPVDSDAKHE